MRLSRSRARLLGGAGAALAVLLLALPAAASAQIAPPYQLAIAANDLIVSPTTGGSTLAVKVQRVGTSLQFTPAAATIAPGCNNATPGMTICPEATITPPAGELRFEGGVLSVEVDAVSTPKMTFAGGAERDTIDVDGPSPIEPGAVGSLDLNTGAGNDSVTVSGRVNAITQPGGADPGDDRYVIETDTLAAGTLLLGPGNDVATSASTNLTLDGGDGADTLSGSGPLIGREGSDILKPSILGTVIDGEGPATVAGPTDVDRLSYELVPAAVTLTKTSATDVQVATDAVIKTGIEQVEGSKFDDTIVGTPGLDNLSGGEGNDTIEGRGGGDILDGGPGLNTASYANIGVRVVLDFVLGEATAVGTDTLRNFRGAITGTGNDLVTGSSADETIALGPGDDTVNAAAGNDTLDGGPGNDLLRGGHGSDTIEGGADHDTATYDERTSGEPVNVTLATPGGDGAAGENDTLTGIEDLIGGASNDVLAGDNSANMLIGGPGLNTLDGLGGDDVIRGSEQRDVISGGAGRDQLFGGGDDDSINAFDTEVDVVDCGTSLDDDAQVDAIDQVTACEFAQRGDIPVPVDADGDGFVAIAGGLVFDCNDKSPAVHPGAVDIVDDGIDQDCDGSDEPRPYVEGSLTYQFSKPSPTGSKVRQLRATDLVKGHRVVVTCKTRVKGLQRTCPFSRVTRRAKLPIMGLTTVFKNRRLRPGTTIEVRITGPGYNGKVRRFTIRSNAPTRVHRTLCIPVGKTTPKACPSDEL